MSDLLLEIITPTPTALFQCLHCGQAFDQVGLGGKLRAAEFERYPADMREEDARLQSWLEEILERYEGQMHIHIIDPASPEGLAKSVRHWVRRYPTFIINRRAKVTGWNREALLRALEADLAEA